MPRNRLCDSLTKEFCKDFGVLNLCREPSREPSRKQRIMADFLLEIGLEEVPARMIAGAEAELGRNVNELLTRERLLGASAKLRTFSTPRRLAVLVEDVLRAQTDTEEKQIGPSWKAAFI